MDVPLLNESRKKKVRRGRRREQNRLAYASPPSLPTSATSGYHPPIEAGVLVDDDEHGIGAFAVSERKSLELQSKRLNHYRKPIGNLIDRHVGSYYGKSTSEWSPEDNTVADHSIGICSHGCGWMQCVRTQELGITENCGDFQEIVGPGVYCMLWPFNSIAGRLSLRIQQVDVKCETKTNDDVFVQIMVSVLFRVIVPRAFDAYYRLTDPIGQIKSYVLDVVRSTVPKLSLDEAFSSTTDITDAVFCRLHHVMKEFGYEIVQTLVTDLRPNDRVKASMNSIKAARSLKEAMSNRAEIEKVKILRNAEAHVEELYLSGVGTAKSRMALAKGWSDCFQELSAGQTDESVTEKEVMDLLLQVQYMDTLTTVGADSFIFSTGIEEALDSRRNQSISNH